MKQQKNVLSKNFTAVEQSVYLDLTRAFDSSGAPLEARLRFFARYLRRQDVARLLVRYEIFKLAMPANGSIVECGVYSGGGLFAWMHFSSIMEPYNYNRKVIGFDTFEGFPRVHEKDLRGTSEHLHAGALQTHKTMVEELSELAALHDTNRPLGHIAKVDLVKGDACNTIPEYVQSHPHLLISLLYLDFDVYGPTMAALKHLYPRVVKGGIVAFDELNKQDYPGETVALLESMELPQLVRFPYDPDISYFVKP
jgi:hypothetical protein